MGIISNANYLMRFVNPQLNILTIALSLIFLSVKLSAQTNTNSNNEGVVLFSDFLSNKTDTVSIDQRNELLQFIRGLKCLSGKIYFTGDGFSAITIFNCSENAAILQRGFESCVAGSKIILDNCSFFRDGGLKPIVITKIIVFK